MVARAAGGREVAGSNPVAPIGKSVVLRHFFSYGQRRVREKNELRRKNREEVMGKVTIQSMAKELGLSRNTVAMALKDDPKVASVTRERALRMAKRNG